MTDQQNRLFVPLQTEHYHNFECGVKDWELRGVNNQFNEETVTTGRRVELRRGYSTDDSLWGTIAEYDIVDDPRDIEYYDRIAPGKTHEEFVESAEELLGQYDQFIPFRVDLDDIDTDARRELVHDARAEMDYRTSVGQFGQEFDTAIPCQLRFVKEPDQDTERFHSVLDTYGYRPYETDPARGATADRPYYDGRLCSTDHYNRVKSLVMRGDVVRLYPLDSYVPTTAELARLINAIEKGFNATLEHDPIDRDSDG